MIVERVHNGFVVAPDFKFTEIDYKSSGAWPADPPASCSTTTSSSAAQTTCSRPSDADVSSRTAARCCSGSASLATGSQSFFVAEPGVDALVTISKPVRLAVGASYRFTDSPRGRFFDAGGRSAVSGRTGLNGAVDSIGLHVGGGS